MKDKLNSNKNEENICSIKCFPSLKEIHKDTFKTIVARLIFGLLPGVVTPTRYASEILLTLTNEKLYLQFKQDEFNYHFDFDRASINIPINKIKKFSVTNDKVNEIINIVFDNKTYSLLHPNIENKNLAAKIANYINKLN